MRYFIIHTTPKSLIQKYNTSISGGNFTLNLVESRLFDKTYSLLPTNVYGYEDSLEMDGINIIYSKIRGVGKWSRGFASLLEQIRLFKKIKSHSSVWFYNLEVTSFLTYILLLCFKPRVRRYILLADFTPGQGINRILINLINKADGLITLSDSNLFTVRNKIIMPGFVPTDVDYPMINKPFTRNFLISGAIRERIASISILMESFSRHPNFTLNISGKLNTEKGIGEKVNNYTSKFKNIHYYGVLSFDAFKELLNKNTFVLSTRDPSYPENQCNFPSKILEALLHNRIVISTIHYNQLKDIKYFKVPSDQEGFEKALVEIMNMTDDELAEYANQSSRVKNLFSAQKWSEIIQKIESI